ncbi:hypothetical protein MSP8886_01089 [Marinomonas spartinae]|uniref:Uncharacterized protein n=1 Tax=Marinomonas spartinae TaxID=1792290 RepID=A0A1A8T8I9_9GAMM|nr:hypothetical protein [Marinomonas spartinae]SBS28203.1 hypothetical protein MSP8886_01089 [Marinomonas spartinae]
MLIKKLLYGYRGGVNFKYFSQEFYTLDEKIKVDLNLPICNPIKPKKAKLVNYPLSSSDWFENNYNQILHSKYIPIHEAYWFYWPVIPVPFQGELGNLRLNITASKAMSPVSNIDELGLIILKEYNEYYNSPVIGKYFKGHNVKLANNMNQELDRRATKYSREEREDLIASCIFESGFPEINHFEKNNVNGIKWVRYIEGGSDVMQKKYVYATLLNEEFYLLANFTLDTNMSHSGKKWYKDAEASIPRLMEGINLEFLDVIEKN